MINVNCLWNTNLRSDLSTDYSSEECCRHNPRNQQQDETLSWEREKDAVDARWGTNRNRRSGRRIGQKRNTACKSSPSESTDELTILSTCQKTDYSQQKPQEPLQQQRPFAFDLSVFNADDAGDEEKEEHHEEEDDNSTCDREGENHGRL